MSTQVRDALISAIQSVDRAHALVCETLLELNDPARRIRIEEDVRQEFLDDPDFLGAIADILIDENCVDF
jgi:hypothetical protein